MRPDRRLEASLWSGCGELLDGLTGDVGDQVEVLVVVQEGQLSQLGGSGDEQVQRLRSLRPTDACRGNVRARPTDRLQDNPNGRHPVLAESELAREHAQTMTASSSEVADHQLHPQSSLPVGGRRRATFGCGRARRSGWSPKRRAAESGVEVAPRHGVEPRELLCLVRITCAIPSGSV